MRTRFLARLAAASVSEAGEALVRFVLAFSGVALLRRLVAAIYNCIRACVYQKGLV